MRLGDPLLYVQRVAPELDVVRRAPCISVTVCHTYTCGISMRNSCIEICYIYMYDMYMYDTVCATCGAIIECGLSHQKYERVM